MAVFRRPVRWGLWLLLALLLMDTAPVRAQQEEGQPADTTLCVRALAAAESQYLNGAFDEAIRLVSSCLNQDQVPPERAVEAYRLLALSYIKKDELDSARQSIVNLLGVDPDYEPDPVQNPPAYVSLVAIVKRDLQSTAEGGAADEPTPFFRRTSTWLTLGGTLVAGGVATFFALQGGGDGGGNGNGDPSDLPPPPGTPQ